MAGITLEYQSETALAAINQALAFLAEPAIMLRDMGEYLLIAHDQRWATQTSPGGVPWAPLSPAYLKRKRKNKDKILQLDGYLKNTLRYQLAGNELLFGSNRVYAAMQHYGGTIDMPARSQEAYFKRDRSGNVGQRFTKKAQSNFAQRVTIGAYTIEIPARPWLGTSTSDDSELLNIAMRYLQGR